MRKSIYSLNVGDLCYDITNSKKYRIKSIDARTINNESVCLTFELKNVQTGLIKTYSEERLINRCVYISDVNDITKSHLIFVPKQKFKIGDKIIVPKTIPKNAGGPIAPMWTSSMNEFLGCTLTIKSINRCYIYVKENVYVWFTEWFMDSSEINTFLKRMVNTHE